MLKSLTTMKSVHGVVELGGEMKYSVLSDTPTTELVHFVRY